MPPTFTQQPRTAYARRDYDHSGQLITFISADRADNQPLGWQHGWFEDGHVWEGYALVHVTEPSWRVRNPVATSQARAA